MVRHNARSTAKRIALALAALSVAAVVTGCPPIYQVETGDWAFNFSGFPVGVSFGLTLHSDGTATPYESTPGYGVLPGEWAWQTNGTLIWFYNTSDLGDFTYAGTLLSGAAAYGNIYEGDSRNPIGNWQAARDD